MAWYLVKLQNGETWIVAHEDLSKAISESTNRQIVVDTPFQRHTRPVMGKIIKDSIAGYETFLSPEWDANSPTTSVNIVIYGIVCFQLLEDENAVHQLEEAVKGIESKRIEQAYKEASRQVSTEEPEESKSLLQLQS